MGPIERRFRLEDILCKDMTTLKDLRPDSVNWVKISEIVPGRAMGFITASTQHRAREWNFLKTKTTRSGIIKSWEQAGTRTNWFTRIVITCNVFILFLPRKMNVMPF